MGRVIVYEELDPTSSYTRTVTATIPADTRSGEYTLTLHTDYTNVIFEHANENNNYKEITIEVVNLPSDLKPTNMVPLIQQNSREASIGVTYDVENIGEGSTSGLVWYDSVYLSMTAELNLALQPLLLKRIKREEVLLPGERDSITINPVPIPRSLVGAMYVIVRVNSAGQLAESNINNNVLSGDQVDIPNINPALRAVDVKVSNSMIFAGNNISIYWTVQNTGTGTLFARSSLVVNIFISTKAEIDFTSLITASEVIHQDINVQESRNMSTEALIPEELAGDYFVIVKVPEETYPLALDPLSLYISLPITVHSPASPDFVVHVDEVTHQGSTELIYVTWTVTNVGNSMSSSKPWCDRVVLSSTAGVISGSGAYSLGEECFEMRLQHQQTYTASKPFLISQIPTGEDTCFYLSSYQYMWSRDAVLSQAPCWILIWFKCFLLV